MMKKYLYTTLLLLLPFVAMAENYNQMWKNVTAAQQKDQPQTVLRHLQGIAQKAENDRQWGHLIKAQLMIIDTQQQITPDSLKPQFARFEAKALTLADNDVVLASVYNCVLGRVYADISRDIALIRNLEGITADECKKRSREYFAKAVMPLDELAKEKAGNYEPLVMQGDDSRIFGNDLLHVVLFEAREYDMASKYYRKNGNNAAACISALYHIHKERFDDVREINKSKHTARLDSLISEYPHLPETGEVAIERFTFMDQATDASAQEKIEYIDYALRTWPTWPRMAVLRNARSRITLPSFHVQIPETAVIPDKQIPVYITSLINLSRLHMTVTKLKMTGAEEFDPSDDKDMKMIRSLMADKPFYQDSHDFYGLPAYKEVRDTMNIIPLPVGVYLVEFTTDNKDVKAERAILHVSNLRLLDMDMPEKQVRLIAVNATTGKPVSGAKIVLQFREWKNGRRHESEEILTTEHNGEVTFSSSTSPWRYRVMTQNDKAMTWTRISTSWAEKMTSKNTTVKTPNINIYTDRSIYRPKQTIEASVLAYNSNFYTGESEVVESMPLTITLRDGRGKEVTSTEVTTDKWGVAAATFTLPEAGEPGSYRIVAEGRNGAVGSGRRYIRVEEYKRPTFVVTIDDYDKPYKSGDTITVRGWAKTYSGVPVQNAKVEYSASSRTASWWLRYLTENNGTERTFTGEATTAEDGSFEMRLPIILAEPQRAMRYSFCECGLNAKVTSLVGESREAQRHFPVSNKQTALLLDHFEEKQCIEQPKEAMFTFVNNAGTAVDAEVCYTIDGNNPVQVSANKSVSIDLSNIEKGEHMLRAYCQNDSLEQRFVLFSLDDKRPVIETEAWYYDTPGEYQSTFNFVEGEPVRMQLGTSCNDQMVFYSIISEYGILEEGSLVLNNENLNRSFIYDEKWGDGIALRYSWARNGKVYTFHERLHRPEKSNELKLEWTTFRDKLVPGQAEQWSLRITDAEGNPASAHMIATIYDKSLEVLSPHALPLNISRYSFTPQIFTSQKNISSEVFLYGEQTFKPQNEPTFDFSSFAVPEFICYARDEIMVLTGASQPKKMLMASTLSKRSADVVEEKAIALDTAQPMAAMTKSVANDVEADENEDFADVQIRENLNETAAFMPMLTTDKNGVVTMKFTLPEALTTWHMLGVAHDKQMNYGHIAADAIAQKQLMVQPNMPRFLREGDKSELIATITNTTDKTITGTATLQIINPENEKVVYQGRNTFSVDGDNTSSVAFTLPSTLAPDVYICKVLAKSKTFSDGEQQYFAIISKQEKVMTTRAITQVKAGKKTIDLDELFGKNTKNEKVSIQYTNNPAWMMVDALPEAIHDCAENDNAVKFSAAIYAATLAHELKLNGVNAELSIDSLEEKSAAMISHLQKLQNGDGSFSWYPDMPGSPYITLEVVRNFVRLDNMLGVQESTRALTDKAMRYLASVINKEVNELKRLQSKGVKNPMPSELAMDYLYLQALCDVKPGRTDSDNISYLLSLLKKVTGTLTIYGKSNLAVAFAKSQVAADKNKAEELLESVMQYSVATETMGRYFDTPKAQNSWRNYKIPTETAVIEAVQTLHPDDLQTIAEMRQWLLNEKRTQLWDTPINTTSAIYAFLNGNITALDDVAEPARIILDGKTLLTSGKERGFFQTTEVGRHQKVVFDKRQDGMSFGAVKTEAVQTVSDVKTVDDNSLHVKREIITPSTSLKVGDKVTVRITLTADRDMDFVEVDDGRAACLEPVNQVSGYRYGCYVSPRDTHTCYAFYHLPKGRAVVVDTEYYVDRSGNFESGLLTARCAYAPEFSARAETINLNIDNK